MGQGTTSSDDLLISVAIIVLALATIVGMIAFLVSMAQSRRDRMMVTGLTTLAAFVLLGLVCMIPASQA